MARFEVETNIRTGRTSTASELGKVRYGVIARLLAAEPKAAIRVRDDRLHCHIAGDAPAATIRDLMMALDQGGWID